jgi:tetratricopeptide (TPR) repeat protein
VLATRIVAAVQPALRVSEIGKACRKADGDLRSRDLVLRAIPGVLSLDRDGNAKAFELLERARCLEPDDALAAALSAWAHGQRIVYHFTSDPSDDRARGIALARRAQRGSVDATTLAVLSTAFTLFKDITGAEHLVARALQLDGSSAWAWSRSGWVDLYKGDARSAIERFMIALDLAPHDPLAFNSMVGIGCAHFEAGRYAEAAAWQERALREHPSSHWIHRTLCPAYVLSGADMEARRSLQALRQTYPDLTMSDLQIGLPPLPEFYCGLLCDALSSVGLPS